MGKQIVFLIGFMASGKTFFGKKLATAFGCARIDLDAFIEERTQLPIKNIFSFWGETKFREIEKECLHKIQGNSLTIVSCGGGTPCFFDNIDYMNKVGVTVFIDLPVGHLISRLIQTPKKRPMIEGKSSEELRLFIVNLLHQRRPFYEKAQIRYDPIEEDLTSLMDKIKSALD